MSKYERQAHLRACRRVVGFYTDRRACARGELSNLDGWTDRSQTGGQASTDGQTHTASHAVKRKITRILFGPTHSPAVFSLLEHQSQTIDYGATQNHATS